MRTEFKEELKLKEFTVEHLDSPLGIDVKKPRFAWKLASGWKNVKQTARRLCIFKEDEKVFDSGKEEEEECIEVTAEGFTAEPKTRYRVRVTVWDNYERKASIEGYFETGKLGMPFVSSWVEPEQEPTPDSMEEKEMDCSTVSRNLFEGIQRDFKEFRPAQYVRIPFEVEKGLKKARIYATAHGIYRLYVNGRRIDQREFAPENTSYHKILQYQTYDATEFLRKGKNVIGVILGDGWWAGRVGVSGDSCQYGNRLGLLLDCELLYMNEKSRIITGEQGRSSTGPIVYSDLFVGEKYDAQKELTGWNEPEYEDSDWKTVKKVAYSMENLVGQSAPSVRTVRIVEPVRIFTTPLGETVIDMGQVMAGNLEIALEAPKGRMIRLEHSEVLDNYGNYYNNILGTNKEQTDIYITKEGFQKYRPSFTYHGFRYVRVTGWPGKLTRENIKGHVLSSEMEDIGFFETSDERLNKLQKNIWWSQVANSISIPTDCPQREKAGWTGDIMVYGPTMCFLRGADAFLTAWMSSLRADQLENGAVPDVVPLLKAYEKFITASQGSITSSGWGDAVLMVPYGVYMAYGDKRILEENYEAMKKWLDYIQNRAEKHHPAEYKDWDQKHKVRSRYLWNTDFHYGDWLIPSVVLGNPDGAAMMETAYVTMRTVAPAYYAFSAKNMSKIAGILGKNEDEEFYNSLYEKIRQAFIEEYVHEDGIIEGDFQGIYVIALKNGLVPQKLKKAAVNRLCSLIQKNQGCLDTGFLSIPFLMDVLCENGRRNTAYSLLFQTKCPSWLYEVEKGATTMWESWGAVGQHGEVSTYSYNHYAFGCIGEWMYKHLGGLHILEPGYKKFRVAPAFDCGLNFVSVSEETPYGKAEIEWKICEDKVFVSINVPVNTTAEICLPGKEQETVGSGYYTYLCDK